jgi:hypothetical protein
MYYHYGRKKTPRGDRADDEKAQPTRKRRRIDSGAFVIVTGRDDTKVAQLEETLKTQKQVKKPCFLRNAVRFPFLPRVSRLSYFGLHS